MIKTKPILVTGAFGQVGKRCVKLLLGRGCTVIATDIRTDKTTAIADEIAADTVSSRFTPIYVDLVDQKAVLELVTRYQPAAIIHLASIVSPPCYLNPVFARRVNVDGTRHLIEAAKALPALPLFVFASSSAVYGSRNPYRNPQGITLDTPVNPVDCYGEDKVTGENLLQASGLPYAILRLGGVISPDGLGNVGGTYLVLVRATPGDNKLHAVDARDVALAFANAADLPEHARNKIFLIGGNESYKKTQREIEDDVMEAIGIGRLGAKASLPGNPDDDRGWSFTDWFDTAEAQTLLQFQQHEWKETTDWVANSIHPRTRFVTRLLSPALRFFMRLAFAIQRKLERRGRFADPWTLIAQKYGDSVLASRERSQAKKKASRAST